MRLFAAVLLAAASLRGDIRFLAPQQGSQVFGPSLIEIATSTPDVNRVEFYVDGVLAGVARQEPYRITHDFGDSPTSRTIAAHVYSDQYRTRENAEILTAALTASESVDVDLVEVPFRAHTDKPLIHPADLSVRENGIEQRVLELRSNRGPTSFYFVMDRSLSMGSGKLKRALAAVDLTRAQLRPDDDATVIFFNHRVESPRKVSQSDKVVETYRHTLPSGGTSLRDALASIRPQRRSIAIVISDGADRNSSLDAAAALQRVAGGKLSVYSLLLGGGAGAEFLREAGRRTGGTSLRSSPESMHRDIQSILADINSRYTAVYQSRGTRKGWRGIQLVPRRSDIQIAMVRPGYYAE